MKKLFALLLIAAFIVGCGPTKIESKKERYERIADSVRIAELVRTNGAVLDSLRFKIPPARTVRPDCDSICDAHLQSVLKSLNFSKSSGQNSYKIAYDEAARMLSAYVTIAETINRESAQTLNRNSELIETEYVEIPVAYTPKWMIFLSGVGGATLVYLTFQAFSWIYRKIAPLT